MESTKKFRKTKKGLLTNLYGKMKVRKGVDFTLSEFHDFAVCKKFDRLYDEWVKSNYHKQKKPSIDRISNKKPYTFSNMHWLTWAENRYKQSMEMSAGKGKVLQLLCGEIVNEYKSQRHAVAQTGLCQSGISSALTGRYKYCGGYEWKYAHDLKPKL